MPSDTRALSRAARTRAKTDGIPYTEAHAELVWMRELIEVGYCETEAEASAFVRDPANQTMCGVCGWTYGMVCPECTPGCGCSYGCTGWRHREHEAEVDDDPAAYQVDCEECGGSYDSRHGSNGYDCTC